MESDQDRYDGLEEAYQRWATFRVTGRRELEVLYPFSGAGLGEAVMDDMSTVTTVRSPVNASLLSADTMPQIVSLTPCNDFMI